MRPSTGILRRMRQRVRAALRRHSYSFFSSLGALMSHRAGTLMTLLVIGIAMLLPLGLHLTLVNLERVDLQEEQWGAMSVFMAPAANASAVEGLMQELRGLDTVERGAALSPAESMQEFLQQSGFSESMLPLDDNPLPWVITVVPVGGAGLEARVLALSDILPGRPLVEAVELDREWLQRLGRFIELGEAVV